VKIVDPIVFYKADKVYLLHMGMKEPYIGFLKEVKTQLKKKMMIEPICMDINILDFRDILRTIIEIIKKEGSEGNHIYVNVGAGPQIFCAGALIACMMKDAIAFNVRTEKFTITDYTQYYIHGKPVGLAKKVHDPVEIPEFDIQPPKDDLILGLKILNEIIEKHGLTTSTNIINKLTEKQLMIKETEKTGKISQNSVMKYRRNFLDQWKRNNWVVPKQGRKLEITDQGKIMIEIFGGETK
jgi:hypothetical protein